MPWPKTSRGTGCDPEKAKASRPSGTRECQATESCHEVASQQVVEVGRLLSGLRVALPAGNRETKTAFLKCRVSKWTSWQKLRAASGALFAPLSLCW